MWEQGKIVTVSDFYSNKCHKVLVIITDFYCKLNFIKFLNYACFSVVQQLLHASCGLPKTARGGGGTGDPARSRAARGALRAAAGRSRAPPGTAAGGAPGGPRRAGLAAPVRAQESNKSLFVEIHLSCNNFTRNLKK